MLEKDIFEVIDQLPSFRNLPLKPVPPLTQEEKVIGKEMVARRKIFQISPEEALAMGIKDLAEKLKASQSWRNEVVSTEKQEGK